MHIISSISEPLVFFGIFAALFILFALVIFSFLRDDQKLSRQTEEDIKKDKLRISELEEILAQKKEEQKEKFSQLEDALRNKEEELKKRSAAEKIELEEKRNLKSAVSKLESQLQEKEGLLKKEAYAKEELNNKLRNLEDEVAKLKRELFLANQMYEGLKGQYDELEKDTQNLAQQLEQRMTQELKSQPAQPPETPKTETQKEPSKETNLQQLLKLEELTRSQEPLATEEKAKTASRNTKTDLGNNSDST